MISLSAATLIVARKTKQVIRSIVLYEMKKSAAGWGLHNDNLFPDRKPEPVIKLQVSRRKLRLPKH
ncbi:hypothetical protein SAMN02745165_03014 [Malonomonas rubra DSM 5091]|uniref:Uncharacterized protein n=1 Tax=Malonomonas rubra DSM 5091 TaxID=1122189 RepID=A0A1M6LML8_MALRU|nr:hypothetical protein [Malonomonas rubra]SHJ72466.1 hypothetical protein SAMN02745165_03014 [Malonomonas rubra DSM 5091]